MDISYYQPGSGLDDTGNFKGKYRPKLWSVETGYASGTSSVLPTPLPTPTKHFDFPAIDRRNHRQSESDDVFLPTPAPTVTKSFDFPQIDHQNRHADRQPEIDDVFLDQSQQVKDSVESSVIDFSGYDQAKPKLRPITKKWNIQDEIAVGEDRAIWNLATKLAKLRFELYEKGLWQFEEYSPPVNIASSLYDFTRKDGWKYAPTVVVPSMAENKNRYIRKRQPKPTCEFCRNNNNPNYEFHQCKNEYGEVVCPILASLACPICGATGKRAHTRRHCPRDERRKRRDLEMGSTKVQCSAIGVMRK